MKQDSRSRYMMWPFALTHNLTQRYLETQTRYLTTVIKFIILGFIITYTCIIPSYASAQEVNIDHLKPKLLSYALIRHSYFEHASQDQLKNTIIILSIDGGAVYGAVPLSILANIEQITGLMANQIFSVVGGTSIGALIASKIAIPENSINKNSNKLSQLDYQTTMQTVFKSSLWHRIKTLNGTIGPRLNNRKRRQALDQIFGSNTTLSALNRIITLIYAYSLDDNHVVEFSSSSAQNSKNQNFNLVDALMAATAAPFVYSSYSLNNLTNTDHYNLIDAAFTDNNPALNIYQSAHQLFPNKKIILLSLGTGSDNPYLNYNFIDKTIVPNGFFQAVVPAFHLSYQSQSILVQQLLRLTYEQTDSPLVAIIRLNFQRPADSPSPFNSSEQSFVRINDFSRQLVRDNQDILHRLRDLINLIHPR